MILCLTHIGIATGMWAPNGWPWTETEYATLRAIGRPEVLATEPKIYRAWAQNAGGIPADVESLLPAPPNALPQERLPQTLELGSGAVCRLRVSDDLQRWHGEGRLDKVLLTVRLSNFEHADDLNVVAIRLNSVELLQTERCTASDLHFHVLKAGPISPYGYTLQFELLRDEYPLNGVNEVSVELTKRDPKIFTTIEVTDVDIDVRYQHHRHFQVQPLRF